MPSQGAWVRRLMKGGLKQAEPPWLRADKSFLHINRSAGCGGGGVASHLLAGSKAVLMDCVTIHFLAQIYSVIKT